MSFFPGALQLYQNPLISYFNEFNTEFSPLTKFAQNNLSKAANQVSFSISLSPRIKVFKLIEQKIKELLQKRTGLPYDTDYWSTQTTFYQLSTHLSNWYYIGGAQKDFKYFVDNYRVVSDIEYALDAAVSTDYRQLNDFLSKNKSPQRLKPIPVGGVGAVALFNMKLDWNDYGGQDAIMTVNKKNYLAFKLTRGINIMSSRYFDLPLISIQTTVPEIKIYIEMDSGAPNTTQNHPFIFNPQDPYRLVQYIINTRRNRQFFQSVTHKFAGIMVPNLFAVLPESTKHLLGFQYRNELNTYMISEFYQETRFAMTKQGLGIRSDVKATSRNLCESFDLSNYLEINRPFILWISHEYVRYPLFAGYFNTDSWVQRL